VLVEANPAMTDLRRKIRLEAGWIALILLPYLVLLLAVPLGGEFPVLDDFDYAASAWHLADSGRLRFSDWPAMTLVTHVAWGAIASKLAGNSFAVLRGSMCVLSCAAVIAIYAGTRRWGHSRSNSVLAAWCFAVHPMTVEFEYTFMTDITGAALSAVLIASSPVADRASTRRLCGYSVLAGLAYLARETAAIPWILVLVATVWQRARGKTSWRRLAWLTAPAAMMIAAYEYWLRMFHVLPFNRSLPSLDWTALLGDPTRIPFMLTGIGLALAPIGLPAMAAGLRNVRRVWLLSAAIGIAAAALVCVEIGVTPPYRGDIFDLGLRPPEMPLGHIPESLRGPSVSIGEREVSVMRIVTTGFGWFLATGIAAAIIASRRLAPLRSQFRGDTPLPIATMTCIAMAGLYLVTRGFGDRYLLSMIPAAILMLAERLPPRPVPIAGSMLGWSVAALIGLASLIGIQDAMVRSRSYWEGVQRLLQRGVNPHDIDAGLAFGGMYRFNPMYRGPANRGPFWLAAPLAIKERSIAAVSPLTTTDARPFRISFDDELDYRPIDTVPFASWFRSGEVTIYARDSGKEKQEVTEETEGGI
jgi:hypothetical protein